ncbi:hypothetical protein JTE90_016981 [Oedothorax gibbosus]|uniref:Mitochondrial cardiolipin hydrolase n=1 Tax=Oedothorax gibbosus TaxID=931172 RepID=A0AAV6TQ11_9ARAC|nr:hypothetical protein JTE90_016981 [Oedothorax gibbosus]
MYSTFINCSFLQQNLTRQPRLSADTENHFRLPMTDQVTDVSGLNVYPCFLPDEHCIRHIKNRIDGAQISIIVQAYRFTSKSIGEALINCVKRGVTVKILIDKDGSPQKNNYLQNLANGGIEIQVDGQYGRAHNKVIIIDEDYVITGSYNFIDEEDYCDSDTVVFITDACVNKKFRDYYEFINSENQSFVNAETTLQQFDDNFFENYIIKKMPIDHRTPKQPSKQMAQYERLTENRSDFFGLPSWHNCCPVLNSSYNTSTDDEGNLKSEDTVYIDVCFPRFKNQDCIQLIAKYINNAEHSIFIQACSITHESILDALNAARAKIIDLKILIDTKAFDDKGEKVRNIISGGIEVRYDKTCPRGIAHSKTIIIDEDVVLTGSFNLTKSAQNFNQENLLQMKNLKLNGMFKEQFYKKWNAGSKVEFRKIEDS